MMNTTGWMTTGSMRGAATWLVAGLAAVLLAAVLLVTSQHAGRGSEAAPHVTAISLSRVAISSEPMVQPTTVPDGPPWT